MADDTPYSRADTLSRARRHQEALDCLQASPEAVSGDARAIALMGVQFLELGKPDEALAAFERSLALDPTRAAVHTDAASALTRLGRTDEALAAYARAL